MQEETDLPLQEQMRLNFLALERLIKGVEDIHNQAPELVKSLDTHINMTFNDLTNPFRPQTEKALRPVIEAWKDFEWTPLQLHYLFMHVMIAQHFYRNVETLELIRRMNNLKDKME